MEHREREHDGRAGAIDGNAQADDTDTANAVMRARVIHAMTMPFTVQIRMRGARPPLLERRADALIDAATARIDGHLRQVEARFSPFRPDSLVSRANRGDWSALLADAGFAEVYALAELARRVTDGHFDTAHAGGYDPTGIVKGWAIEDAHRRFLRPLLREDDVEAVALGGGGDIQTAVRHDGGFVWRVGVQDPRDAGATVRTIELRDGAVATSGDYRRGGHIARTDHGLLQATVVDDRLVFADMWATTAIAAGEAELRRLLATNAGAADVTAVLVRTDGSIATVGPAHAAASASPRGNRFPQS